MSVQTLCEKTAQRVGFGIQTVVEGWDCFASEIGFSGAEDLFMPYMNLDTTTFRIHVLFAQEGYLPKSLVHNFREGTEPTNVREETFEHVCDRPKCIDLELRKIVAEFLRDIYNLLLEDGLYESENPRQRGYFDQYKSNDEQIPSRFNNFVHGILQTIKNCVMEEPRSFNNSLRII